MKCARTDCDIEVVGKKYCSVSCSNKSRKKVRFCAVCSIELSHRHIKFCSNTCQQEEQYQRLIREWKDGTYSGLSKQGTVTNSIKRYLREKYNNKCCKCGWSEVNVHTGKVPLVADHIDGDHKNNTEKNLRLVCWNCDSLGPTFGGSNKGNGRSQRYADIA